MTLSNYAGKQDLTTIYLDFQQVFTSSQLLKMEEFFKFFAHAIATQLDLKPSSVNAIWETSHGVKIKMTQLFEGLVLEGAKRPLVLIMDEADILLRTSFYNDFFGMIRSWFNRGMRDSRWRKLAIVIAISTYRHLLIDDFHQSPFNVGKKIVLGDFSEDQVQSLNERYGRPLSVAEIPKAMKLLGGHPYLIHQALYTLRSEEMTWPQLEDIADKDNGPYQSHLRRYLNELHKDSKLVKAMRKVVFMKIHPKPKEFERLLWAGLVRQQGEKCICRYGLYEKFFGSQLL